AEGPPACPRELVGAVEGSIATDPEAAAEGRGIVDGAVAVAENDRMVGRTRADPRHRGLTRLRQDQPPTRDRLIGRVDGRREHHEDRQGCCSAKHEVLPGSFCVRRPAGYKVGGRTVASSRQAAKTPRWSG